VRSATRTARPTLAAFSGDLRRTDAPSGPTAVRVFAGRRVHARRLQHFFEQGAGVVELAAPEEQFGQLHAGAGVRVPLDHAPPGFVASPVLSRAAYVSARAISVWPEVMLRMFGANPFSAEEAPRPRVPAAAGTGHSGPACPVVRVGRSSAAVTRLRCGSLPCSR